MERIAIMFSARMLLILIAVGLFSLGCEAADKRDQSAQKELTLCGKNEDIYFSCLLSNGKLISVCALTRALFRPENTG